MITEIGSYSFVNTALKTITLPPKITIIKRYAFQGCSLTEFTIPSDSILEQFEVGVFSSCSSFSVIHNESPYFSIWNQALFNADKTDLIILPPASGVKYFSFPENVITVRSSALEGVGSLEVVFIPSSVKTVSDAAFRSCKKLEYINIPGSIVSIGEQAFSGCNHLQCGLSIENRTDSFIDMLINKADLPFRCLSQCIIQCTFLPPVKRMTKTFFVCVLFSNI